MSPGDTGSTRRITRFTVKILARSVAVTQTYFGLSCRTVDRSAHRLWAGITTCEVPMKLSLGFDCFGAPGIVAGLRRLLDGQSSTEAWAIACCSASDGTLLREFERVMVHVRDLWVGARSLSTVLVANRWPLAANDDLTSTSDESRTSYWLLPSYSPQGLEYAAAQLAAYLFWRAAHHQASVFRLPADNEPARPLAQAPALRRVWHAITPDQGVVIPFGASVICTALAAERSLTMQDALRIMEDGAQADGVLNIDKTRYECEVWAEQLDVLFADV